jgi:hypothetical protein
MRRLLFVFLGLSLLAACGQDPLAPVYSASGEPAAPFNSLPIDLSKVTSISSLGTLLPAFATNPWDETLPSDHIYLNHGGVAGIAVYAPALGLVTAITSVGGPGQRILIRVNGSLYYYFDHLSVNSALSVGSGVGTTTELGTSLATTNAVDFGVIDYSYTNTQFINPARYADSSLHGRNPILYFNSNLQSQLYAKVNRQGGDKNGRADLDQSGQLVGSWFLQGLSVKQSSLSTAWPQELAFAYDSSNPSVPAIASGGSLGFQGSLDVSGPDPAQVNSSSGLLSYSISSGTLLVQMQSATSLEAEYFSGAASAFDSNASYFSR